MKLRFHALRRELVTVCAAAAVVFTARTSLADHYIVPTGSMIPTVEPRDRVFVDKLAYGLRVPLVDAYAVGFAGPARGDVVVLESPENGDVLLKRIVAIPGDRVRVARGALEIDGTPIPISSQAGEFFEQLTALPHAVRLDHGGGPDFGPRTIERDRYLVMGDNRGDSHDGRDFGLVPRRAILGRAVGIFMRDGSFTWIGL